MPVVTFKFYGLLAVLARSTSNLLCAAIIAVHVHVIGNLLRPTFRKQYLFGYMSMHFS